MAVDEFGYYSPNEGLPQRVGPLQSLLRAATLDIQTFSLELRRSWAASTDVDFLMSSSSRRDLWRLLLPIPALFALLVDSGPVTYLDSALIVVLFVLGSLPTGSLVSDAIICFAYSIYLPLHANLESFPSASLATSPVAATFAMASCGLNASLLSCFVLISAIAAPYISYEWTAEQIVATSYVALTALIIERRSSWSWLEKHSGHIGYKSLTSMYGDGAVSAATSRMTAEALPLSRGAISDGEEPSLPLPPQFGFVDQLFTQLGLRGRAEEDLSYPRSELLQRSGPMESVGSQSGLAKSRFAPAQVRLPGAAIHEAPKFAELEKAMAGLMLDPYEANSELSVGTSSFMRGHSTTPSTPGVLQPGSPSLGGAPFLRGIILSGFKNPDLNKLFVEKPSAGFVVNGRETYWPTANDYFIYYSINTSTWGIGKAKRFQQIKEGKSNGLAHSPEGFEIWVEGNNPAGVATKSWREWDVEGNKWVSRAGAGVQSRGKVRPKISPSAEPNSSAVGVQTDTVQVFDQETQTSTHSHSTSPR